MNWSSIEWLARERVGSRRTEAEGRHALRQARRPLASSGRIGNATATPWPELRPWRVVIVRAQGWRVAVPRRR